MSENKKELSKEMEEYKSQYGLYAMSEIEILPIISRSLSKSAYHDLIISIEALKSGLLNLACMSMVRNKEFTSRYDGLREIFVTKINKFLEMVDKMHKVE